MEMYYCPQGCQGCVGEGHLNLLCGGCSSVMTTDSTRFDALDGNLIRQKIFKVYIGNVEEDDESLMVRVFASSQREASLIVKNLIHSSPDIRKHEVEGFMEAYYCPKECQRCARLGRLDLLCGECGSAMTKDKGRYDVVHVDLIEQQITRMKKRSRK
jgi:hypothetical protein